MISTAIVGALGFLIGIAVGMTLREALEIARGGHTQVMRSLAGGFDAFVSSIPARYVGVGLVSMSLAANAAIGFVSISTRGDYEDLVSCVADYNERDGIARDERALSSESERQARRALWRTIRRELRDRNGLSTGDVIDAISTYLRRLDELDRVVLKNPYPPADLCGGSPDDEEPSP